MMSFDQAHHRHFLLTFLVPHPDLLLAWQTTLACLSLLDQATVRLVWWEQELQDMHIRYETEPYHKPLMDRALILPSPRFREHYWRTLEQVFERGLSQEIWSATTGLSKLAELGNLHAFWLLSLHLESTPSSHDYDPVAETLRLLAGRDCWDEKDLQLAVPLVMHYFRTGDNDALHRYIGLWDRRKSDRLVHVLATWKWLGFSCPSELRLRIYQLAT